MGVTVFQYSFLCRNREQGQIWPLAFVCPPKEPMKKPAKETEEERCQKWEENLEEQMGKFHESQKEKGH